MTNLEPIVRKLIKTLLYKYHEANQLHSWYLLYEGKTFTKISQPDESLDQVIDWFYYTVLQCENKEEACQEKK